jgi:sulfotransferase family protein
MTDSSSLASTLDARLAALAGLEPRVIGATGGSGTRVVGRIVRAGGMYIGTNLNDYQDALDLAGYSDRWINGFVVTGLAGLTEGQRAEMIDDLADALDAHRQDLQPEARAWGWKEPRSIYLISLFNAAMPGFRFLHFMRDGRDMAFSDNQQQLKKHGDAVLPGRLGRGRKPVRSIALWARVNTEAADFGEQHMGERYLRVRFEDLCSDPVATVRSIYDFFGLEGDIETAAAEVRPPDTLGRWQKARKRTLAELHEIAEPALRRFGYLTAS